MASFHVYRCDACGSKIKNEERAEGVILMPEERARLRNARPKSLIEAMQGERNLTPREERFDLCTECATALLIAFKVRKREALATGDLLGN